MSYQTNSNARFNQNNQFNSSNQYGSYEYSNPQNDGNSQPPYWQSNTSYQQQPYYPQQDFYQSQGQHQMNQQIFYQGFHQPHLNSFQYGYQTFQTLQNTPTMESLIQSIQAKLKPAAAPVEEQKQANNSQIFMKFEDFKPFPLFQPATPQKPVPAVQASEDPLIIKLREEVKVPEEHIETLKSVIQRVQAATKSDPHELLKSLLELKNHYVCTSIKPSETFFWAEQIDRLKFKEGAGKAHENAIAKRTPEQKIKLIVNVIVPDNFDKKFKELREYIFGNHKLPSEPGYNIEADTISDEKINLNNLQIVVDQIFRKAQNEKDYCSFYGNLCEQMISLELRLKNLKATTTTMKQSLFRKLLIKDCNTSFDQFFSDEARNIKETKDDDKIFKFKLRLFNNIRFVGEIFRRKLLFESIILDVFELLLGISRGTDCVNDDTVQGAIQLMEKVGSLIDEKLKTIMQRKAAATLDNPLKEVELKQNEKINAIFTRFADFMTAENSSIPKTSNQIKCLIKNMLENRESGWKKSLAAEAAGPMKVEELHKREEQKKAEEMKRIEEAERDNQRYWGNQNSHHSNHNDRGNGGQKGALRGNEGFRKHR